MKKIIAFLMIILPVFADLLPNHPGIIEPFEYLLGDNQSKHISLIEPNQSTDYLYEWNQASGPESIILASNVHVCGIIIPTTSNDAGVRTYQSNVISEGNTISSSTHVVVIHTLMDHVPMMNGFLLTDTKGIQHGYIQPYETGIVELGVRTGSDKEDHTIHWELVSSPLAASYVSSDVTINDEAKGINSLTNEYITITPFEEGSMVFDVWASDNAHVGPKRRYTVNFHYDIPYCPVEELPEPIVISTPPTKEIEPLKNEDNLSGGCFLTN